MNDTVICVLNPESRISKRQNIKTQFWISIKKRDSDKKKKISLLFGKFFNCFSSWLHFPLVSFFFKTGQNFQKWRVSEFSSENKTIVLPSSTKFIL